jgi:HAD superfamily hydrolase (TIGR01484 family)
MSTILPAPLAQFPVDDLRRVTAVLTDIDDTLTTEGRLPSVAYSALERLSDAGLIVVPITGRPAGWCDMVARFWPVQGVVGENGAFYFQYDRDQKRMQRRYWKTGAERAADAIRLAALRDAIPRAVAGCAISADQAYREADLAIDFCEDVVPLSDVAVDEIVAMFEDAGAQAKVSSIHVNGWFGDYDKLTMTQKFFAEICDMDISIAGGTDMGAKTETIVFVGDSPNDAPMFAHFPNAVGVANVMDMAGRMAALPAYVTARRGGEGFAEFADVLLGARDPDHG